MKAKRFIGLILVLMLFVVPSAFALTMADLLVPGAKLTIEDKEFYGFAYVPTLGAPPAANVEVVELPTPGNPGLRFVAAWGVLAPNAIDSNISYYVKVLPGGAPIVDIGARMAGAGATGEGFVNVAENVFAYNPVNGKFDIGIANIFLYLDIFGNLLSQEVDLANPTMGPIYIVKDIILNAGTAVPNGLASVQLEGRAVLSFVENTTSEKIPEPISLILLGSGLAGVGLYRRLRKPRG